MDFSTILLVPEKTDRELERLAAAWIRRGGPVKKLGKYWLKDEQLAKQKIAIYGNQAFALVLAQLYEVELVSPDDTLLAKLKYEWTKRSIELKTIGEISPKDFPVFIKPVLPKIFTARVFQAIDEFKEVTNGLPYTEQVLVSDIIENIQAEARCFVKDGVIKDIGLYEGSADLRDGEEFVMCFLDTCKNELPNTVVVDIAYNEQLGWFILEFNACWGAGLNGCEADKVIDCIIEATVNG
jgi:hypothetical protein